MANQTQANATKLPNKIYLTKLTKSNTLNQKYHQRWGQHCAIFCFTVDTVYAADLVYTVDMVYTFEKVFTVDLVFIVDLVFTVYMVYTSNMAQLKLVPIATTCGGVLFQAGVLSIENAKFWPFWPILAILSRIYPFFGVLLHV